MDYKTFYEVVGVGALIVSHLHLSSITDAFAIKRISDGVTITITHTKRRAQNLCDYLNDLANYGVQGVNSHR